MSEAIVDVMRRIIALARPDALVASFRGGKAVKLGYYNDQAEALKAVGLAG